MYWYTAGYYVVSASHFSRSIYLGQYSQTKEEEEKKNAVRKATQRVKIYIGKNFGIWKLTEEEWKDDDIFKIHIIYDYMNNELSYQQNWRYKYYSPIGCLRTIKDYEQLIADCKDDLELIFK